jgi:hypothetical protein
VSPLCSSNNLAGFSLVRIVEEELIAVAIIDYQEPIAPPAVLDRSVLGFELSPQRIEGRDRAVQISGRRSRR